EPSPPNASFVVDDTPPTGSIQAPDSRLYLNSLPTLSGTAGDISPGVVTSVVFRVERQVDGAYWNWQTSTFTALSGASTDLTPSLSGGLYSYTTDYFQVSTGTGTWQRDKAYVVHEVVADKAGNTTDIAHAAFTFDLGIPTATIVMPSVTPVAIRS